MKKFKAAPQIFGLYTFAGLFTYTNLFLFCVLFSSSTQTSVIGNETGSKGFAAALSYLLIFLFNNLKKLFIHIYLTGEFFYKSPEILRAGLAEKYINFNLY